MAGTGGPTDPLATDSGGSRPPEFDFTTGIAVPRWSVGDWWSYSIRYESGETYEAKFVVFSEDGSSYRVTTDDRELILRAGITHYPNIGGVVKSTLNQFIHGVEVSFLKFPMKNGTWEAPYRDFTGAYETHFSQLDTGKGEVPGFVTTMRHAGDGQVRFVHGWSPVTKWFTDFQFDFDGTGTPDVVVALRDWGTDFNGTLPVVELVDLVHRPFPTVVIGPPDPANPPGPEQPPMQDAFTIEGEGSSLLLSIFASSGGPGRFDFGVDPHSEPAMGYAMEWQPSAAGSHFAWAEHPEVPSGPYNVVGQGWAQGSAFLFGEAYEVRTTQVTL